MTRLCAAACLALAVCLASAPLRAERWLPYAPGEKLHYEIYWTIVHAGSATLEVMPPERWQGVDALRFRAEARSTPFVDAFYKVRTNIESVAQADMERALYYHSDQNEGSYRKDAKVEFDWNRCVATRTVKDEKRSLFIWPPQAYDPLSMLFHFRAVDLREGLVFEGPVTDGKKFVMGRAVVGKKEKVQTAMGEFEAFRVEPQVSEVGGVFQKSPNARMRIWISADGRRLPVKVQSEVIVGSFTLELVRVDGPAPQ